MKASEIQQRAEFTKIRYAQCWEDSRLLSAALQPKGRHCLSIGSAGDNSFALLAAGAASVTAVEMNAAQVACIELRRAAYLRLDHQEFLELLGSRPSTRRLALYQACRDLLPDQGAGAPRPFWDRQAAAIGRGIGGLGKFENYFALFRRWALPLAHSRREVRALLEPRAPAAREQFYRQTWDNRRWRWLFQVFFSRTLMGAFGRDPEFFRYVEGPVSQRIMMRARHALAVLDPAHNPYLHWILTGTHGAALPEALEERNFDAIRQALADHRFEVVQAPLEALLAERPGQRYDAFNLSDIFEYMSEANTADLLAAVADAARPGARLAYWNMLAPRSRPETLAHRLKPLTAEAAQLFAEDRAFFYSRFVVEEVLP